MNNLLITESPLIVLPSLAKLIGLNEAIVLQQVHYLLNNRSNGRVFDGERWIFNTYEQWHKEYFPFFSIPTIQRTFAALETAGLIVSCQPEGAMSRRKYYRVGRYAMTLNLEKLQDAEKVADTTEHINLIPSGSHQSDTMVISNCDLPLTETSSETTADTFAGEPARKTLPKVKRKRAPDPIFDAIAEVSGMADGVNDLSAGRIAVAKKNILQLSPGVTPDEIRSRAATYRKKWPKMDVTPTGLAANWSKLSNDGSPNFWDASANLTR